MKKLSARISKLSYLAAYFFSAVLFVSANSASSLLSIKKHLPSPFGYWMGSPQCSILLSPT